MDLRADPDRPREGNLGSRRLANRMEFPPHTVGKVSVRWSLPESHFRDPSLLLRKILLEVT